MSNVRSIPDAELIRRVISDMAIPARTAIRRRVPLWSKVSDRFSLGSTYAAQLCRRFEFDPDQEVLP